MQILLGRDVDVIAPYPRQALQQAAQWMHCYKTLVFGDDGPQSNEDIQTFLSDRMALPFIKTWGIIDKHNLTNTQAPGDAPLVGIVFFEQATPMNGYFHCASNRRAWGEKIAQPGLVEQAGQLILEDIFQNLPQLQRVSAATFAHNRAAKNLIRRLGFFKDGYFTAMGRSRDVPVDVIHYGMLRQHITQPLVSSPDLDNSTPSPVAEEE